ncbi:MAG: SUMF1/EgtB/PvdO family nonheme iron enzyme, partial [Gemmataceae bacterium]
DADATFSVGLIYGPSGCGKSSLLKAGLLPRLAGHVVPVFIEATRQETEGRLLRGLKKRCPALEEAGDLVQALSSLRQGRLVSPGTKFLLVIDQFEQWLHLPHDERQAELIRALRQCDGEHLQCLLLVRDDFAMAATRFMAALDVPIVQGSNFAIIDNFDPLHARKILASFGRAFGRLPEPLAPEQEQFLDQAIAGLAPDERVVPVRLALFAEMIKGKPWTLKTLKEIGGTEGVGLAFLEETFSSSPTLRHHERAARAILKALLPAQGSAIKGSMLSKQELLDKSGYAHRPTDFEALTRILDAELRLITPTDPQAGDEASARQGEYFQLTHDYLVQSLRDWLTRKQRETRRGRAELLLTERATFWNSKPETRFLPTTAEWLRILLFTRRHGWLPTQRKMMQQATRFHLIRGGVWLSLLAAVLLVSFYARARFLDDKNSAQATQLVGAIQNARTDEVPGLLEQISPYRQWADPLLRRAVAATPPQSRQHLHCRLALLPIEPEQAEHLLPHVLHGEPPELLVIARILQTRPAPLRQQFVERLWNAFEANQGFPQERFRVACVLASHDARHPRWPDVAELLLEQLLDLAQRNPSHYATLLELLGPLQAHLLPLLEQATRDGQRGDAARLLAANFLSDFAREESALLTRLLLDADRDQFLVYFAKVEPHKEQARAALQEVLARPIEAQPTVDAKEQLARRQANAAIALIRFGEAVSVDRLLQYRGDPRTRSYLIDRIGPFGVKPGAIIAQLDKQPEPSVRRALILCLGEFDQTTLPVVDLLPGLLDRYANDPDPGIHAAIAWLLRSWHRQDDLDRIDRQFASGQSEGKRLWYVTRQGQTLVVVRGPVDFVMGSPPGEAGREGGPQGLVEKQAPTRIAHSFALGAREVSAREFGMFRKTAADGDFAVSDRCPINLVSWYDAVAYCNWLSEQEGIPRDQWCYVPNEQGNYGAGTTSKPDYLELAGYRLPTEAEWEFACRAGTSTSCPHGDGDELLEDYAWYTKTSLGRQLAPVGSLRPNDFGLFDMLGNVAEWCQDRFLSNNKPEGGTHTMRGGSFVDATLNVRSAVRDRNEPDYRDHHCGFRVARTITRPTR